MRKLIENFTPSRITHSRRRPHDEPGTHTVTLISAGWDNSLRARASSITVQGGGAAVARPVTPSLWLTDGRFNGLIAASCSGQHNSGNPTYRFDYGWRTKLSLA